MLLYFFMINCKCFSAEHIRHLLFFHPLKQSQLSFCYRCHSMWSFLCVPSGLMLSIKMCWHWTSAKWEVLPSCTENTSSFRSSFQSNNYKDTVHLRGAPFSWVREKLVLNSSWVCGLYSSSFLKNENKFKIVKGPILHKLLLTHDSDSTTFCLDLALGINRESSSSSLHSPSCPHFFFFFWLHPEHAKVPRPGIEPTPQQQPEPQCYQKWGPVAHHSKANKEAALVERNACFISNASSQGEGGLLSKGLTPHHWQSVSRRRGLHGRSITVSSDHYLEAGHAVAWPASTWLS